MSTAAPLLQLLGREAAATVAARLAAGRAEAAQLREAARAHREAQRAQALATQAERDRLAHDAAVADATQRTRRSLLDARAAFLSRVLTETERQLEALPAGPALDARLAPLLADSLPYVTGAALRAHCASASRNAVVAALAAAGAGADAVTLDEAVACGAILERMDGSVSVDATFRARLRTQWRALAIDAVRFLNGDAPA